MFDISISRDIDNIAKFHFYLTPPACSLWIPFTLLQDYCVSTRKRTLSPVSRAAGCRWPRPVTCSIVSLQFLIKVIINFHKEPFQIESCHPPPAAWSVWEPVSCWGAPQSCPRQLPPGVYHACPGAHHQHPAERSGFSSCLSTKWEVLEIWDSMEIILCLGCTRKDRPSTVEYIIRHFFLLLSLKPAFFRLPTILPSTASRNQLTCRTMATQGLIITGLFKALCVCLDINISDGKLLQLYGMHWYLSHSLGDQDLAKFLKDEIATEKQNSRPLPKLSGWDVKADGSEVCEIEILTLMICGWS